MSFTEITEVRRLVKEFFKGDNDKTALWMSSPNPLLGNTSPVDMVMAGREDKLLEFVKAQMEANSDHPT
jgi:uncharacterized protein (DUF2384 family)